MSQRGATLVEVLLAVAIATCALCAAAALLHSGEPFALRSATMRFDALTAHAQAVASAGDGATLSFTNGSSGVVIRLYAGRPDAIATPVPEGPALRFAPVTVLESTLGAPPFVLFFDGAGRAVGRRGAFDPSKVERLPACPAAAVTLTFRAAGGSAARRLACPPSWSRPV